MFYTQLVVALVLGVGSAPLQKVPDFSGVWEIIDIAVTPKPAGGAGALPPTDLTVTQTSTFVSLARPTPWGDVETREYSFDGREQKRVGGAVTEFTRSTWAGNTLVIEGRASQVTSQGYAAWTLKETIKLDARGQLIIERNSVWDSGNKFHSVVTHRRKKAQR